MINITIDEVKQTCNLMDLKRVDILTSKFAIVDAFVREHTKVRVYNSVVRGTASELVSTAFKTGFAYFVYAESIDFLNTNTTGAGIVGSTGFSDSRIDMLSGAETEKRRDTLEFKAFSVLKEYLNDVGFQRYTELKKWDDARRSGVHPSQSQSEIGTTHVGGKIRGRLL